MTPAGTLIDDAAVDYPLLHLGQVVDNVTRLQPGAVIA